MRNTGRQFLIRSSLAFAHDVVAAGVAWLAAFWLRFELQMPPPEFWEVAVTTLPAVLAVHAVAFWALGLYRGLWRYASLPDLQRILVAVAVAALAVPALFTLVALETPVPRSVYLIMPVLLIGAMCGSRLLYRAWKERTLLGMVRHPQAQPVLVLGAGSAASSLLRDLANSNQWRVVGLLDDDAANRGSAIQGVKILGALADIGAAAARFGVAQAIIAMPGATHTQRRRAVDLCSAAGLEVMTVPSYADLVSGRMSVSALRNVELDDLLGRDPVALDDAGLRGLIEGKCVLVTGAGGSIGAELCRQIARYAPSRLVLFELSEFALYAIEQEFRDRFPHVAATAVIGDAKDEPRVRDTFARFRPQIVFHAAAYKHVPLMEGENASQAVANNVLSTVVTARAAQAAGAQKFVLVSTDKAVNPTNVMGASKRLAELACQALAGAGGTQFVTVRFGNVLGSTGSVIPRFREQIARGGPVTVTHPDIQRYFMSIPEATQLVLQAALMGKGGEIFVLDMGEPVRIVELARQLIRLSGLSEDDIRIEYTGLRPGEKLYEELLAEAETTLPTPHPKLRVARASASGNGALVGEVIDWIAAVRDPDAETVRERLRVWVPEYAPAPGGAKRGNNP
ncbi:MAG TPA: nucleoside-diphosphate sugar epimerase/dehydratase [Burkholderiales bacterium]|nr:nucleoside-diphosphate sugar epimerase/dehydratase [Burkholderiales bacterium]